MYLDNITRYNQCDAMDSELVRYSPLSHSQRERTEGMRHVSLAIYIPNHVSTQTDVVTRLVIPTLLHSSSTSML
jgi:hypothetical protein